MANSRIPVSPLEYSADNLGKAIPGELLVDYNKGKIYVKSKKAPYEIIDITNSVISVVEDMNGENLKINRENVGLIEVDEEAKLISVLQALVNRTNNNVKILHIDDITSVSGVEIQADNESITLKNNKLQVGNYSTAGVGSIPIKTSTGIKWSSPDIINESSESSIPENSIDGLNGSILEIIPDNGVIELRASLKQMTTNLRSNVTVTLPATLDKFSEIEWCVVTTNFIPVLFFSDNVIWVYGQSGEAHKAIDNAFIVYKFQTWDNGAHWLAQRKLYSENYNNYEGIIDEDYLNENYYNKKYIDDKLSWLREERGV